MHIYSQTLHRQHLYMYPAYWGYMRPLPHYNTTYGSLSNIYANLDKDLFIVLIIPDKFRSSGSNTFTPMHITHLLI